MKQLLALGGLLFATAAWGAAFILVKITIESVDLYWFLFLRFFAAFLLLAALKPKRLLEADRATIKAAFILSLYLIAVYVTQTIGLLYTTASNSALITCLYMVFIPIVSAVFYKTRTNIYSIVGIVFALVGLFLLTQYSFGGANLGDALTVLCAVASVFHIILTGRYASKHRPSQLVLYQFLFMSVYSLIGAVLNKGMAFDLPPIGWLTVGFTAVFATVMAMSIQAWAQRIIDPTRAGIIFSLEAVFGPLFGWLWGGETMTTVALFGAGLMLVGIMIAESKPVIQYLKRELLFKLSELT